MNDLVNKQRNDIPQVGKLGRLSLSDLERILKRVKVNDGCWIWQGTVQDTKKGHQHGCIWYNKHYVQVHRIMYHNFIGDVPEYSRNSMIVLHTCTHLNNGRCVNPWHLSLGTPKQNTQDALKAGTLHILKDNEQNPMSKLSNLQIEEIRSLKHSGLSQREIALQYGIHQSQVSRYLNSVTRKRQ